MTKIIWAESTNKRAKVLQQCITAKTRAKIDMATGAKKFNILVISSITKTEFA